MTFETIIGLEVHVQLKTESKLFCGCTNEFGREPNTLTCPVCAGHPGVLPVLNERALDLGLRAALALNCDLTGKMRFDRKNYFYPDLPKGYQITQLDFPLGRGGAIEIDLPSGEARTIRILRVHLEEDAGKTVHPKGGGMSEVDLNRAGVPLLEIVSEPDLRSPREAHLYLDALKRILRYAKISDCDMEKGSLRCDANLSIRREGDDTLGVKTEIKNLNSFHYVEEALRFEERRQRDVVKSGRRVKQETRMWRENEVCTETMRSKEEAHDYRYFPEPDLPCFHVSRERIRAIASTMPELPRAREARMKREYGLPEIEIRVLMADPDLADFFERCVSAGGSSKEVSNWIRSCVLQAINERGLPIDRLKVTPMQLVEIIALIRDGTLSHQAARKVFFALLDREELDRGGTPAALARELGLEQVSDQGRLDDWIEEALKRLPQAAEQYLEGKKNALNALIGEAMKASKGKANPGNVRELLVKKLQKK